MIVELQHNTFDTDDILYVTGTSINEPLERAYFSIRFKGVNETYKIIMDAQDIHNPDGHGTKWKLNRASEIVEDMRRQLIEIWSSKRVQKIKPKEYGDNNR